jgi:fluoroacetyl-CoA thioesterase
MFDQILPGLLGENEIVVGAENTARHLGSGEVSVLATPEMIRLMERAAVAAVDARLPGGYATVGVRVDVRHLAATPVGMKVLARAELKAVEDRKLVFEVEARDEVELVGAGIHERFIIDVARFRQRVEDKKSSL